jgi:hypothetical protein
MCVCVCVHGSMGNLSKCEVVVLHEVVWPAFYKLRVNVRVVVSTHDGDDQSAACSGGLPR